MKRKPKENRRRFHIESLEHRRLMAVVAGDFNNDGYTDFVQSRNDYGTIQTAGAVEVSYGTRSGLARAGKQIWHQDSPGIAGVGEKYDYFGRSLAVGDFNRDGYDDLAIGVPYEDIGSISNAGAVNVIYGSSSGLHPSARRSDQLWHQNSNGIAGVAEKYDYFGASLAAGDFNRDGYEDLAIGVSGEDIGSISNAGAVNVIYGSSSGLHASARRSDQLWHQNTFGIAGAAEKYDKFGASLAAGDFNRDGYEDLAIGVSGEDIGSITNAGAVNVIYGSGSGLHASARRNDQLWHQNSSGVAGAAERHDYFGNSLAVGDFNRDGYEDLAIGVSSEDIGSIRNAGAVNVIYGSSSGLHASARRSDQIWHQNSNRIAGVAENYDNFGRSLAVGDFNRDGYDDLAIGVPYEDIGSISDAGAVNVIYGSRSGLHASARRSDQIWHQNSYGIAGGAERYDRFGSSLIVGDFDGDGYDDLGVEVNGEDIQGDARTNSGAANLLYGSSGGLGYRGDQLWHKDKFEIQLNFTDNNLTEAQRRIVTNAALRWSEVIVGDLPDATLGGRQIDDLFINVSAANIDGSPRTNNTLAQASPNRWRNGSDIPYSASMTIDTSDLSGNSLGSSTLFAVAMHEMGHTLGFHGTTLSNRMNLRDTSNSNDVRFTGTNATREYNRLFGTNATSVPMAPATSGGHWRESVFDTELMTPLADSSQPLSRVTVAALQDMGYRVNLRAANNYSPPPASSTLLAGATTVHQSASPEALGSLPTQIVLATPRSLSDVVNLPVESSKQVVRPQLASVSITPPSTEVPTRGLSARLVDLAIQDLGDPFESFQIV